MANTTNFNWETPDDTDLVKDGAAAIRTLGSSIDTSFVDLKGGTTGQILSKASNTDLDYTWINNDQGDITAVTAGTGITGGGTTGSVTITNDMATTITASGDIVVGTGNATYDNLPIGTTGQVLTADTTVSPYKVKWASPAAGGKVLQVVSFSTTTSASSSTNTKVTTGITASITPSSASSKVLVLSSAMFQKSAANAASRVSLSITRGATDIYIAENITYNNTATETFGAWSATYLDSPATTSSTTYTVNFANAANVASVSVNPSSSTGSIVLLEIGA